MLDRDAALAALDEDHEAGQDDHEAEEEGSPEQRELVGADELVELGPSALGMPTMMPEKITSEMPLPMPALGDLLAEPHDESRAGGQRDHAHEAERQAGLEHRTGAELAVLEGDREQEALEEREPDGRRSGCTG